ncbi:MAG: hypothetical protein ACQEWW_15890 [Bacillota bacterium]
METPFFTYSEHLTGGHSENDNLLFMSITYLAEPFVEFFNQIAYEQDLLRLKNYHEN